MISRSSRLAISVLAASLLASTAGAQALVGTLPVPVSGFESAGIGLAVDGDWAAASAFTQGSGAIPSEGHVFLFRSTASGWQYDSELTLPPSGNESYPGDGKILAMDGQRLAYCRRGPTGPEVLTFERLGDFWLSSGSIQQEGIGVNSIAMDGDLLSFCTTVGGENRIGVYEHGDGGWTRLGDLIETHGWRKGIAQDIEGDWLVLGDPDLDGIYTGEIDIYKRSADQFSYHSRVWGGVELGTSLELDDGLLVAGAFTDTDPAVPMVRVFEHQGSGFTLRDEIQFPEYGSHVKVATSAHRFVVGLSPLPLGSTEKEVLVFERGNIGSWRQTCVLDDESTINEHIFATHMAFGGDHLLIGRPLPYGMDPPYQNPSSFSLPAGTAPYGFCSEAIAPCGNDAQLAGCVNSLQAGATLHVTGSASVARDDLVFRMESLPSGQNGLLCMGAETAATPFGDGVRRVGAGSVGLFRFPVRNSGVEGAIQEGPGLVQHSVQFGASGAITAGSTWFFQGMYRDPAGPCGSFFNLTSAVRATYQP